MIIFLFINSLNAQVDVKKEQQGLMDDYDKVKSGYIRQGRSSGLNADRFDDMDSWEFLRSSAPANFQGSLGLGTSAPRAALAVVGGGHFTSSVTASAFFGDGAGITNLPSSSLSAGSTNYIQNVNSLQSGSTFYVASGTVDGQTNMALTSGSLNIGTTTSNQGSRLNAHIGTNVTYTTHTAILDISRTGQPQNSTVNGQRVVGLRIFSDLNGTGGANTTANVGAHIRTLAGDFNYPLLTEGGNVGIGVMAPTGRLHIVTDTGQGGGSIDFASERVRLTSDGQSASPRIRTNDGGDLNLFARNTSSITLTINSTELLRATSNSVLIQLPGVVLTKNETQYTVSGVTTTIAFGGTEIYDTDNYHFAGASSDTIFIPLGLGGTYHLTCNVVMENVNNSVYGLQIFTGAGAVREQPSIGCPTVLTDPFQSAAGFSCRLMAIKAMAAGDSATCRVSQESGGTRIILTHQARFSAIRIGP